VWLRGSRCNGAANQSAPRGADLEATRDGPLTTLAVLLRMTSYWTTEIGELPSAVGRLPILFWWPQANERALAICLAPQNGNPSQLSVVIPLTPSLNRLCSHDTAWGNSSLTI